MPVPRESSTGRVGPRQAGSAATLSDGTRVLVREITPDDRALLADGMRRLSSASRYQRFHTAIDALSEEQLRYLTEIDHHDHDALVAVTVTRPARGVGVARYVRMPGMPDCAEIAVTVLDEYQGRGVGKLLLAALLPRARKAGIERLTCRVLADNDVMLRWFTSRGAHLRRDRNGLVRVEATIDEFARASDPDRDSDAWPDTVVDRWLADPDSR